MDREHVESKQENTLQRAEKISFLHALKIGIHAIKDVILPGYILLILAAGVVVMYYNVPAVTKFLNNVGDLKNTWGYTFSCVHLMVFSGLVPWGFRMIIPWMRPAQPMADLFFCLILWGIQGIMVDTLYRMQANLFGNGTEWHVVLKKLCVDQFGYSAIISAPLNALTYYWKDQRFSFNKLREALRPGWYKRLVLPNYLALNMIWIPGVSLVYSLPSHLQIFIAGLISCFFSLICAYVAFRSAQENR